MDEKYKHIETKQHSIQNQWVKDEIKNKIIKKKLETNENGNATFHNLWDTAKTIITEKVIVPQPTLRNKQKPQINNLTCHLKELEKEQSPTLSERRK